MTETAVPQRDNIFILGVILVILFSAVIGFFHVGVLYLFGIPIFGLLVGISLVWIGKAGPKEKIIASAVSIPLIFFAFAFSMYINKADPETFLVPENYRGEIVVFYNEPCGQEPEIENGRRVYRLSENGILITKFGENDGFLDRKFYLIDAQGARTQIPLFLWQNFETEKKEMGAGTTSGHELTKETVGAFHSYGAETYHVSQNSRAYIISDYRYYDRDQKERGRERKAFSETAELYLHGCRESE